MKFVVSLAVWCLLGACAFAGADEDWQQIKALDAGPGQKFQSREEAMRVTAQFLEKQERAYRSFLALYPDDAHALDVKLRLAHLLAVKADFTGDPALTDEAQQLLEKLAADPSTPAARLADVDFARLSLFMRSVKPGDPTTRAELLKRVCAFQKAFPSDRRVAPLLAETATLFDDDPSQKQSLLAIRNTPRRFSTTPPRSMPTSMLSMANSRRS